MRTMLEAARILGFFSAALLIASIAAWVKLSRGPTLQRLDGRSGSSPGPSEFASQLLVAAVCSSAVAAILAIMAWFVT